MNKRIC